MLGHVMGWTRGRRYESFIINTLSCWLLAGVLLAGSVRAEEQRPEPHGLRAIIAKQVLRKAAQLLRSRTFGTVCDRLAGAGGKEAARVIKRYRMTIADKLDELAKWGTVTQEMIWEQLTGALHEAGLAHSTARRVAFYVAEAFGWIVL